MTVNSFGQTKVQRSQSPPPDPAITDGSAAQAASPAVPADRKAADAGVQSVQTRLTQAKQTDAEATQRVQTGVRPPKPSRSRSLGLMGPPKPSSLGTGATTSARESEQVGASAATSATAGPQEDRLAEHVQKALASGDGKDLARLREFAKELRNNPDQVISDLGKAAENACAGIEAMNKPGATLADRCKGMMSCLSAGPLVARAAINGFEKSGALSKETANDLRSYLATPGTTFFSTIGNASKALESFGNGEIRKGLQSVAEMGADGVQTAKPFLKAAGMSDEKIKALETLANGSKDGLAKINKGIDLWDRGRYSDACKEWGGAGRDLILGLAPFLGEAAQGGASALGALGKATGEIAGVLPQLATVFDDKQSYFDRLNAAQEAGSKLGVVALRGLATAAFGDKWGNALADGADWVREKAVSYDQETGKIWKEAMTSQDKAWNATIENGDFLAGVMGFRRGDETQRKGDPNRYAAMENFAEFWASNNKIVGDARVTMLDRMRQGGPSAALDVYEKFLAAHKGEQLIKGW